MLPNTVPTADSIRNLFLARLRWCERALDFRWTPPRSLALDVALHSFEAATGRGEW